jgi:pilus assembly protein CpaD
MMRADNPGPRMGVGTASRRLGIAALCALLLSACDGLRHWEEERNAGAVGLSNPEVRHPIGFMARNESLAVEVPPGARGLSPNQQVDVYRFLHRHKREATGPLAILLPARGGDTVAVRRSLRDIRGFAADAGIDYRVQRASAHDGRSGGPPAIRLAYQRPVAVPPPCDQWTEDVGRNDPRIPYPNWGCATQRNLALMVDNARDLQQPQEEDPRSSERRGVTWSAYVGNSGGSGGGGDGGGDASKKAPASAVKK